MAGKGKKKKSNEKAKKQTTTKKSEVKSKSRCNVDIFNEHAMDNAYYTCHNIQDVLKCRGFPWPDAQKKKKKGKKR
ncbi:Small lysine-rich protein 1 [Blattella germanica]|nr:Small lysine-rich protein 1 [Blattella germanica]